MGTSTFIELRFIRIVTTPVPLRYHSCTTPVPPSVYLSLFNNKFRILHVSIGFTTRTTVLLELKSKPCLVHRGMSSRATRLSSARLPASLCAFTNNNSSLTRAGTSQFYCTGMLFCSVVTTNQYSTSTTYGLQQGPVYTSPQQWLCSARVGLLLLFSYWYSWALFF